MKSNAKNCLFCDSARHTTQNCASTMKGNIKKLHQIMSNIEYPDFASFTLQELKYIAFTTIYQKSLETSRGMHSNKLNREYGRKPIPLTLPKKRMIKALQERWESLASVREKYQKKPTEDMDDCPICLESIQNVMWSWRHSEWSYVYNPTTVKTICNHHFCSDCWNNIKPNLVDGLTKPCPLCRRHVADSDIWISTTKWVSAKNR